MSLNKIVTKYGLALQTKKLEYLTFTALLNNSTIKLVIYGFVKTKTFFYRINTENNWHLYSINQIITLNYLDKIEFYSETNYFSSSKNNYYTFFMSRKNIGFWRFNVIN